MQTAQKRAQKDMELYEERQKLLKEIQVFDYLLPFVKFDEEKRLYDKLTVQRKEAMELVNTLSKNNAPLEKRLEDLEATIATTYKQAEKFKKEQNKTLEDFSACHKKTQKIVRRCLTETSSNADIGRLTPYQ